MKLQIVVTIFALIISSITYAQSLDETFSNPTNLTDQQMDNAKNFNHQGIKDRAYKEACAKDPKACENPNDGIAVEELIGKAYGILGVMANKLTAKPEKEKVSGTKAKTAQDAKPEAKDAAETNGKEEKKEKTDWCIMAAAGSEVVTSTLQSNLQKKADNQATNPGDAQLQSLLSLKQTHEARSKTAYIQSAIYGGVTACYGIMWSTGQVKPDANFFLRMGGAVALTGLYVKKAINHENYSKRVQSVIDSIPVTGKCNPWTGTKCFCTEATSKDLYPEQYQEVCVLNKGDFSVPKVSLGCAAVVEGKTQFDKECKCKQTNSCVKSTLKAFNPNFGIGTNLMNQANQGFDLASGGDYDQGKLDAYTTRTAALAAKMKAKIDTKTIPKVNLTEEQKKIADALSEYMPLELANNAAVASSSYKGGITDTGAPSVSALSPAVREKLGQAMKIGYEQGTEATAPESAGPEFEVPNMGATEEKDAEGNEVLTFANKAIDKADVSNSPETPIFDIISNRYKRSGWKKLERLE